MKNNIISACIIAALLSSCSSAYKTSQTPDDVYYSPQRNVNTSASTDDRYDEYASNDDQYLRMKVQNHYQWGTIDDYSYWQDSRYFTPGYYSPYGGYNYNPSMYYSPFSYGYYNPYGGFGSYMSFGTYYSVWSPFSYSPYSYYSPYSTVVYYKNPPVNHNTNSTSTLGGYGNRTYSNTNSNSNTGRVPQGVINSNNTYNTNKKSRQTRITINTTREPRTTDISTRPVRTFSTNVENSNTRTINTNTNNGFKTSGTPVNTSRPPRSGGGGK